MSWNTDSHWGHFLQISRDRHTIVKLEGKDVEADIDYLKDPYLAEDPIILPEHLQSLVDQAMVNVSSYWM